MDFEYVELPGMRKRGNGRMWVILDVALVEATGTSTDVRDIGVVER